MTNDLRRRVEEHKLRVNVGFTARHGVVKLVWYQEFQDIREAMAMEKRIKNWRRAWKLQLIDSFNHDWRDLAEPHDDE